MLMTNPQIPVLGADEVRQHLASLNTRALLKEVFNSLHKGTALQPAQTLSPFPGQRGDFISYAGILGDEDVFAVKVSPYIVTEARPIVTAWTMLMSMTTGQPLLLCDAGQLTVERTAATSALAVEHLARPGASVLAVIGVGQQGVAHIRHMGGLRNWKEIRVYSPSLAGMGADDRQRLTAMDPRVRLCTSVQQATEGADAIALCTSSATPVVDPTELEQPCLVTSISTNSAQAHEVPPAALLSMDVYCDYAQTTPASAYEMRTAAQAHGWSASLIKADLSGMVQPGFAPPQYRVPVYFRSIGLGLEDAAVALALYKQLRA
jgi:L-arginine dehydrogenase